jgi:hypothetical protein
MNDPKARCSRSGRWTMTDPKARRIRSGRCKRMRTMDLRPAAVWPVDVLLWASARQSGSRLSAAVDQFSQQRSRPDRAPPDRAPPVRARPSCEEAGGDAFPMAARTRRVPGWE